MTGTLGPAWIEGRAQAVAPARVDGLSADDDLSFAGGALTAGWTPASPGRIRPWIGGGVTLQRVVFHEAGEPPAAAWSPAPHADGGVGVAIGNHVWLDLHLRLGWDTRPTRFGDSMDPTAAPGRAWAAPSLALRIAPD